MNPDFSTFTEKYENGESQLLFTRFLSDLETPVSAMLKLEGFSKYHLLLESVEGGEKKARYSIIALAPDVVWRCVDGKAEINANPEESDDFLHDDDADVFASLRSLVKKSEIKIPEGLPPMSSGLFGYMGYDMVRHMENLPNENPDNISIPESIYIRPTITVIFDSVKDEALIVTPVRSSKNITANDAYKEANQRITGIIDQLNSSLRRTVYSQYYATEQSVAEFKTHVSKGKYHEMVRKAKEYIIAGDIFQVVPSRRLSCKFPHPPLSFYRALRHLNPSPYLFYVSLGGFQLIGSSPEILVRLKDNIVTIRPIAGTRKRGKNEEEDIALEKDLLSDKKELSEHLMLLDLGRNDVGRVTKAGTVKVTEHMKIERYSHVMHIVSNVEGELNKGKDSIDALIAGFPAGTVSGAPKIRAMEIIDELESEKRSFYGGTIGYISCGGGFDTCIALRTGLIKDGVLYVQAGGGVVADSDEEAEFIETENKASALITAAKEVVKFL